MKGQTQKSVNSLHQQSYREMFLFITILACIFRGQRRSYILEGAPLAVLCSVFERDVCVLFVKGVVWIPKCTKSIFFFFCYSAFILFIFLFFDDAATQEPEQKHWRAVLGIGMVEIQRDTGRCGSCRDVLLVYRL